MTGPTVVPIGHAARRPDLSRPGHHVNGQPRCGHPECGRPIAYRVGRWVHMPDIHGNLARQEGVDRCRDCGCKYWEHDVCIDCGGTVPEADR